MKKYFNLFVLSLLFIVSNIQAQTSFEKWIGGPYGGDMGYKIIPALDGGFIVVGSWTTDYGQTWDTETDAVILKVDEGGNLVWRKSIPTVVRYTGSDQFKGVTQTPDGGYIAVGIIQTANDVGKEDVLIAKFTGSGDTVWTKRYDIAAYDCGNAVIPSGDGGYIVVGRCGPLGNDNILFLKINASGDTLWTRTWGWAYEDRLNDVIATGDGSFYAVGCTKKATSPYNMWDYILKLTTNGDTVWTKRLVGEEAISIRTNTDGSYILAEKQAVVKVDANADQVWRKDQGTYLGILGGNTRCAIPVTGGSYIVTGKSDETSPSYNQQLFIVKLTSTGDTVWTKRFGEGTNYKADEGFSVVQTTDGGYLAVGFTNKGSSQDIYLVKVNSDGITAVESQNGVKPKCFALEQNYPNPFNPSTSIQYMVPQSGKVSLKIFDALGRAVVTLVNNVQSAGIHTITWNATNNASGIYYYQLSSGINTQTRKLVLIK
jgi:hypothetical protein